MSERTATPRRTSGGEPSKRSLTERLQDTLSSAAEEHRANAGPAESRGSRVRRAAGRQPRRARLRLTRVDPWSVMKTSFLLSVAFGVVTFVAIFMVWSVLGFTLLVSVVDVILITAIATLTAFLYNLAAALLGGIEVTLAEDEK